MVQVFDPDNSSMREFGENLKNLMSLRNLTVAKLARDLKIPQKTVYDWCGSGGRTPRDLELIKRLATYLDCSTHALLFGEEDPRSTLSNILDKTEIHTGVYEVTVKKVIPRKKDL